jgi:hypothetical protein
MAWMTLRFGVANIIGAASLAVLPLVLAMLRS